MADLCSLVVNRAEVERTISKLVSQSHRLVFERENRVVLLNSAWEIIAVGTGTDTSIVLTEIGLKIKTETVETSIS